MKTSSNYATMNNTTPFECFGFTWRVGRKWGIAHPEHTCWNDAKQVEVAKPYTSNYPEIKLGIGHNPKEFNGKTYPWTVGYVSSLETIKYGHLSVDFILPWGGNIWPAIWLSDGETWPPEIDIVEAWTNTLFKGSWCYRKVKNGIIFPFTHWVYPGFFTGTTPETSERHARANKCGGTKLKYLHTDRKQNTCDLYWAPGFIDIYYNGYRVVHETDTKILDYFNASNGMAIHLNNYVTTKFSEKNYNKLPEGDERCLHITGLRYNPFWTPDSDFAVILK